jgi:hypothetical protein
VARHGRRQADDDVADRRILGLVDLAAGTVDLLQIPLACSRRRLPASVGTAPRPLRCSRLCRNSTSRLRIWRLIAGCAIPSTRPPG